MNRRFKRLGFLEDMISDMHMRLLVSFQRLWVDKQIQAMSKLLKKKNEV